MAVVALSLGLGANAVVFSISYTALFKNLPFVSDRILYLHSRDTANAGDLLGVSQPDFRDWSAQQKSFRGLGAYTFNTANSSDQSGVPGVLVIRAREAPDELERRYQRSVGSVKPRIGSSPPGACRPACRSRISPTAASPDARCPANLG